MRRNIVVTGMVMQAIQIGEYDKRITILTKEKGRITAFARGARKPGSQLMAVTNAFVFGEFELYEGRSTYQVLRASVYEYFRELAEDYGTACYGFYFLELAGYFSLENSGEKELLNLLYVAMKALVKENIDNRLVRVVFELRCLLQNGTYPNVFECIGCRGSEGLWQFDMAKAGVRCRQCVENEGDSKGIFLEPSTIYAMQFIFSSPTEKLYTFKVSKQVLQELERIVQGFYLSYIEHRFKAQCFLS